MPSLGQVHNRHSRAAVFDDVLQGLLRNAEQAERCVGGGTWASDTRSELDSYAESARHVMAQTCDRLREPEEFELWRVEVMRQAVDLTGDVSGPRGQLESPDVVEIR